MLTCHILDTGHCLAHECMLIRGGRFTTVACHSIVALLHHPKEGWILWDAGYAPRMLEATRGFPFRLYRWVTPLRIHPELAVVAQLPHFGLEPKDIRWIILSHFHADHVGGVRDFPWSNLIVLDKAYQDVAGRQGWNALSRAFIPALLPDDFSRRAHFLSDFRGPVLQPLGPTHDLFEDGSLILVELPGHARGQMGLLADTERGRLLFAADSCWLSKSYQARKPPHPLTHLFIDDAPAMKDTIDRLYHFHHENPEVIIVPSHCPEAFGKFVGK